MTRNLLLRRGSLPLVLLGTCALLLALGAVTLPGALADEGPVVQKTFDTPEAAGQALIAASAKNDSSGLLAIFGPEGEGLVQAASDPMVRAERKAFAVAAREVLRYEKLENGAVELIVGRNEWPFPVLLVEKDGKWIFDTKEGKEEILARRVGRNELRAIRIARYYVEAQRAYAAADRDDDGVREYAQKILSSKGKRDGLYWEAEDGSADAESPLGPAVISLGEYVSAEDKEKTPVGGYYWMILKGQGSNAPGGAHAYVINGNMIAGFALVGVPARHMGTGVMTFLVNNQGKVFEKDLGEKSLEIVKAMEVFDPDDTWKLVPETEGAE